MAELTMAVRFLHLTASILALGIFAFVCLVAQPAARAAGAAARAPFVRFKQNLWRLLAVALAVIFISGLAGLVLQAALMTGRPVAQALALDTLTAALTTQYGRVWLVRQILLVLLAGVCALLLRGRYRPRLEQTGLVLAACLLAAWVGASHAAAGEGAALAVQLSADALHLLAAGTWVGALAPLALLLAWCGEGKPEWAALLARAAARRFSWLGIACVSVLVAAGLVNAWNLVNGIAPLIGTMYGRLLLLKVCLLLPMLGFAAVNLLRLRPRLLAPPPPQPAFGRSLAALKRNTLAEAALGVTILGVVAVLGVTPPALHVQPEWPLSFRFSWQVARSIHAQWNHVLIGGGLAGLALAPFVYALLFRRWRRLASGVGLLLVGAGAALALPALSIDAYPTTYRRPAVAYHAISVARGAQLYQQHCVACHGVAGYGDGPAGAALQPKPADLTAKHTGDHTAGDLYWWLTHGKARTAMPGFQNSVSEEERWDLINFLRALSAAEQARPMAPLLEPAWLIAPDFLYQTVRAENKSLKEHRAQSVVLLVLYTVPQSQARLDQLARLHAQLAADGVQVLAVPRDVRSANSLAVAPFAVVSDGAEEAYATYSLFRRSLSEAGMRPDAPVPPHMEFLIDRQGYVRARWIAQENTGWANADILLGEIAQLNREKPSAPAPDDHVH